MADEFKFPDESGEGKTKIEFDVEGDVELEIVDDTPPGDRGRPKLEEEPKEVTDEELATYSADVQKRIKTLTHARHDERRQREAVQREAPEFERAARALAAENQQLKKYVNTGEQAFAGTLKQAAEAEMAVARKKFKDAHEAFDSEAIAAAQQEMMAATLKLDRANNFRPTPLQTEETTVQRQASAQQPAEQADPKALRWQQRNQWFGQDDEMTAVALVVHKNLVQSGVDPRSDEYFNSLDGRMKKRFPDFFEDGGREEAPKPRKAASPVAPASRSTGSKKITLTRTAVDVAKRLGVPLEAYAKQVALQEAK